MPDTDSDTKALSEGAAGSSTPAVGAVSIKLPPFWSADPQIWFAQAEAQFATRQITAEVTKFHHVISSLQPEVAQEVRDILLNPPATKPYSTLKEQLIVRTTASEQRRVQMLLTEEELGDRKPSQLLRRMEQLIGEQKLEKGIFKQLFLQRLPANVRLILASTSDSLALSELAELADKIIEVHVPTVGAVTAEASAASHSNQSSSPIVAPVSATGSDSIDTMRDEIRKLTRMVGDLQRQVGRQRNKSRGRSKSPARSRGTDKSGSGTQKSDLCFYHTKFGDKAYRCQSPCARSKEFSGND